MSRLIEDRVGRSGGRPTNELPTVYGTESTNRTEKLEVQERLSQGLRLEEKSGFDVLGIVKERKDLR